LPSYTTIPFLQQNILLGKYPCVLTGNPQWADGVVLFQSNRVNMVFEEREE
jgi:hypothetical protein